MVTNRCVLFMQRGLCRPKRLQALTGAEDALHRSMVGFDPIVAPLLVNMGDGIAGIPDQIYLAEDFFVGREPCPQRSSAVDRSGHSLEIS